jgi:hypothetical protein
VILQSNQGEVEEVGEVEEGEEVEEGGEEEVVIRNRKQINFDLGLHCSSCRIKYYRSKEINKYLLIVRYLSHNTKLNQFYFLLKTSFKGLANITINKMDII